MKMPASDTAPMAPTLSATRGLSGAVCADAAVAAIESAADRPAANAVEAKRKPMTILLGVAVVAAGKCDLALVLVPPVRAGLTWWRGRKRDLALVVRPQQLEEARIVGAFRAVAGLVGGERDSATHDLGFQLLGRVFLQESAAEEGGFRALADHDAAVTAHLHRDLVAECARQIGRLVVVDDEPRIAPGRHAAVKERAVQEHRHDVVAGDAEDGRVPGMKVRDTHAFRAIAVNAGMDAPFQWNEAAGMMND